MKVLQADIMASASWSNVTVHIRRNDREQEEIAGKTAEFRDSKVKDEQGAKDKLEELNKFLTDHETVSPSDCTHEVLNGIGDWW